MPYDEAVKAGMITVIGQETDEAFLQEVMAYSPSLSRTMMPTRSLSGSVPRMKSTSLAFASSTARYYVRDKDAVTASLLLTEMAAYYYAKGMTVLDAYQALCEKHGFYGEKTHNLVMPGLDGLADMAKLMKSLREAGKLHGGFLAGGAVHHAAIGVVLELNHLHAADLGGRSLPQGLHQLRHIRGPCAYFWPAPKVGKNALKPAV